MINFLRVIMYIVLLLYPFPVIFSCFFVLCHVCFYAEGIHSHKLTVRMRTVLDHVANYFVTIINCSNGYKFEFQLQLHY